MSGGVAAALLAELRRAGASVFIDREDGESELYVSPPARCVNWPTNVEQAIDSLYQELHALVDTEDVDAAHLRFARGRPADSDGRAALFDN